MRDVTEATATDAVIGKLAGCDNARLKQVMSSFVRHLHGFVREIEPTQEEWFAAIKFLTATGHMCDDKRQEFILLSDTLGVSTLVELINNRKTPGMTETSVLGPFWVEGAPYLPPGASILKDGTAADLFVHGRVHDAAGRPIADAVLDVWQTAPNGMYDVQDPTQPEMNLRGKFTTGADGAFNFWTIMPTPYPIPHDGPVGALLTATGRHPWRPAHLHFIITAPGYRNLTTALYFEDDPYVDSDAVFGVKSDLVVRPRPREGAAGAEVKYDFGLERTE
jgi:hydroxyquinol 1,2-dioxygenase